MRLITGAGKSGASRSGAGFQPAAGPKTRPICRIFAPVLLLHFATAAHAQVWDKYLAPGLTYRMEVDLGTPRLIHAVRFSPPSKSVSARPELGNLKVFSEEVSKSRQTISELVKQAGAIGGINADFFPFTGDPLGLMVRNGELMSAPYPLRAVFAWGDKGSAIGVVSLGASLSVNGGLPIAIDGVNEECAGDKICLNTPASGFARAKSTSTRVVLRSISGTWNAGGTVVAEVASAGTNGLSSVVEPDTAQLVATGSKQAALANLSPGDKVSIELRTEGLDWSKYAQAVGGGPFLVRNGSIAIDWEREGFKTTFANNRHPRTAVGKTRDGDVWFVTIDGRQAISAGATLEETARIMLRYGCVDAINLDGGGSTTFNLFGVTLNRPSDGKEREVANGVLFYGAAPAGSAAGAAPNSSEISGSGPSVPSSNPSKPRSTAQTDLKLRTPDKLFVGEGRTLAVVGSSGAPLPNASVIWVATGKAWIDQGGMLHPAEAGSTAISAWVEGKLLTASLPIEVRPPPPPKRKGAAHHKKPLANKPAPKRKAHRR